VAAAAVNGNADAMAATKVSKDVRNITFYLLSNPGTNQFPSVVLLQTVPSGS
jgi:hypothetical protein